MIRRLPILVCLAVATALPASAGSWLQEGAGETRGPSAAERHGIRRGSHEIQLHAGYFHGDLAYSADRIAPPLNAEPVRFRVELDGGGSFGLGYAYQAHERWAVAASLTRTSGQLQWETPFDRAAEEAVLLAATVMQPSQGSEVSDAQVLALLDRIEERSRPRDLDLTMFDVGAVYVINPDGRWIGEVGGGLGWAFADADEDPMLFELLFRNACDPTEPNCTLTIANELVHPSTAGRCPADDDPCVELTSTSGLSWHALGGLRYAFTDAVHLRMGLKVRLLESITDPGDTMVTTEGSMGLVFRFGGD